MIDSISFNDQCKIFAEINGNTNYSRFFKITLKQFSAKGIHLLQLRLIDEDFVTATVIKSLFLHDNM